MILKVPSLIITELGIGSNAEGIEVRSVGNTLTLRETALIEAFNLKAAIEYEMKNCNLTTIVWLILSRRRKRIISRYATKI